MAKADFPYDPTLLEQMQKNLERRRHQEYLRQLTPEQKTARQSWVDAIRAEEQSLGGSKPKRRAISMTKEDKAILETLANEYPMAVIQDDLADMINLPRQKIGKQLQWLESNQLVERPEGTKRKGHAITPAGLSAIGWPVKGPH